MFKPSEEKSAKSHELINKVFLENVKDVKKYTVTYAYYMKSGLFSQKMFSYVIGFSISDKELIVIPITSDGEVVGDIITLKKENIVSAKYGLQGNVKIKSDLLKKELSFFVPGFTPPSLEDAYVLPILQEETAIKFKDFIKESF